MDSTSPATPTSFWDSFDPDEPQATLRQRLGTRSQYLLTDEDPPDDTDLFPYPYQLFIVRWPNETIELVSALSRADVMYKLDELGDPGSAMVKPFRGPIGFELSRSEGGIFREDFALAKRRNDVSKRKTAKTSLVEWLESGQFSDVVLFVPLTMDVDSEQQEIRAHRIVLSTCPFFAELLARQEEAEVPELRLRQLFPEASCLQYPIVRFVVKYIYDVSAALGSWQKDLLPDLHEVDLGSAFRPVEPSVLEGKMRQKRENVEKWIDICLKVRECALFFGLGDLAAAADSKMRGKISGLSFRRARLVARDADMVRKHDAAQEQAFKMSLQALWELAGRLEATIPLLSGEIRRFARVCCPIEDEFVRFVGPTAKDLALYQSMNPTEWNDTLIESELEFGNDFQAKISGLDDQEAFRDEIESKLYPHRYFVKKLSQEGSPMLPEFKEAVVKDEEYMETSTGYQERLRQLEGRDDPMAGLMRLMDLTHPGVLATMLGPASPEDPAEEARKRARAPKDERDVDEPPTKRTKRE